MQTAEKHASPVRPETGTQVSLPLDQIDDNPWQPRLTYDAAKLEELATSIRHDGLMQPIVVRRGHHGRFEVLAGHRRLRAFRLLLERSDAREERRFAAIPALVRSEASDDEMARLALNENLQRDDLSPVEAAKGLAAYREMTGLATAKELALKMGLKEDRVRRLLKLNEAPNFIKTIVDIGLVIEDAAAGDGAAVRRTRKRLDLMAALHFASLHRALWAKDPKTAEARTTRAIERTLREGWNLRRIERHVQELVADKREQPEPEARSTAKTEERVSEVSATKTAALFEQQGTVLLIREQQMATASPDERQALFRKLCALVEQLHP